MPPQPATPTVPNQPTDNAPADVVAPPEPRPITPAAVEFASRYLGKGSKKPEDTKPPEEKPAKKVKAAPKAQPKAEPTPVIDEEKLGRTIGESVAKAMKPEAKVEEKKPEPTHTPAEARKLKVFKQMEEMFPDQYKGFADKYQGAMKKLREYAAEWERKHPGETFDEDAEEHGDFVNKLEADVAYEEDDYSEALAVVTAKSLAPKEEAKDPEIEKIKERLNKFEIQDRIAKAAPVIEQMSIASADEFWKSMGGDYAKVINDDGTVNNDQLLAIKNADEDTFNRLKQTAIAAYGHAREIYLLENGLTEYDAVRNPSHKYLSDTAIAAEEIFQKRPPEKQLNDEGKPFVTKAQWNKLTPEERAKVWTFTANDLGFIVAKDLAKRTLEGIKAEEEAFTRRARQRGLIVDPPKIKDEDKHPMADKLRRILKHEPEEVVEDDGKPITPATPMVPRQAPSRGSSDEAPKGALESWTQRAIHGR